MPDADPLHQNHVHVLGNLSARRSMVFVHGFATDQQIWSGVAPAFMPDWRVVLMDNVGAGQSDPAAFVQHRYLHLRSYSGDLVQVCEALDVHDAVLVGHSIGAMVCVLASLDQPWRFSRLVLLGASPRYLDDDDYHGGMTPAQLDALYSAATQDPAAWARAAIPGMMGGEAPEALVNGIIRTVSAMPQEHMLTMLCAVFQSDVRREVAQVRHPTLILETEADPIVPESVTAYLHRCMPASQVRRIDTRGHMPHVTAPQAVVAAIRAFLAP